MAFLIASIASIVVVLVSPFMGQLQAFLRRSLTTENYVLLFGASLVVAVGGATLYAFLRVRERRLLRFGALAVALAAGGGYLWSVSTPWPEVNAVERVHFVEYGLIVFLYYRAWRPAGDLSILILPVLLAFMVGTLDEWLQWFIPVRVGELHDVLLNLVSIVCGLVFAVALQPPSSFTWLLKPESRMRFGVISAGVWLVCAGFVSAVHLGHENEVDGIGRFLSRHTVTELDALQAHRAESWKASPPTTLRRLSQEDQYLDEGIWHARRRNQTDGEEAWRENLILERLFAPVLDIPTYASPNGNRWAAEQRANLEARLEANAAPWVSRANPYPIILWPKRYFWPVAITMALLLAALPFAIRR